MLHYIAQKVTGRGFDNLALFLTTFLMSELRVVWEDFLSGGGRDVRVVLKE